MIENIVRRAKKLAVKREIGDKGRGLRSEDLIESIRQEFRENETCRTRPTPTTGLASRVRKASASSSSAR